ncbi:ATP phosphoribosyltransferase [bacterium]|jgi:ATP phosphoribosyltransferase|nr:ATP phosphoribosyltransferase [bacterium]
MSKCLTIAIAKGYLFKESLKQLKAIGIVFDDDVNWDRRLSADSTDKSIRVYQIRPWDVPDYVAGGAADVGIVGHDVLIENKKDVSQLIDLKFGYCRLVVAGPKVNCPITYFHGMKVATKYPRSSEIFFRNKGIKVHLIKLYGAIELAPLTSLSDIVCDLTATGTTLRENDMEEIETIYDTTARLISNNSSLKFKYKKIIDLAHNLTNLPKEK